jgi:tRNA G18 (ribose-2'-O)-methylase SpoU
MQLFTKRFQYYRIVNSRVQSRKGRGELSERISLESPPVPVPVLTTTITDLDDPRIADYRNVPDAQLLRSRGLFLAEGRIVVRRLLEDGRFTVRSILSTPAALAQLEHSPEIPSVPVFVVSLALMRRLTGFNFHRGCLALAERPVPVAAAALLGAISGPGLVVVLEDVTNADNVGGVFRNALAFGARAVFLSPGCCDPFYRKAVRTSMAATLRVACARLSDWPDGLAAIRRAGFRVVVLTPAPDATPLAAFAADDKGAPGRIALLVGTEGDGVSAAAAGHADARVRIPMQAGVDSLNLATATGIALYSLSGTRRGS